jgi:hypothetical protein
MRSDSQLPGRDITGWIDAVTGCTLQVHADRPNRRGRTVYAPMPAQPATFSLAAELGTRSGRFSAPLVKVSSIKTPRERRDQRIEV